MRHGPYAQKRRNLNGVVLERGNRREEAGVAFDGEPKKGNQNGVALVLVDHK